LTVLKSGHNTCYVSMPMTTCLSIDLEAVIQHCIKHISMSLLCFHVRLKIWSCTWVCRLLIWV